jgi:hypothetical protein
MVWFEFKTPCSSLLKVQVGLFIFSLGIQQVGAGLQTQSPEWFLSGYQIL